MAAVRALAAQQASNREPTSENLDRYRGFCGWGAVPRLFDERPAVRDLYAGERAELRTLLGDERYRAARAATLNSHYTNPAYAQAIWQAVTALGFAQGSVLEPGCGTGVFIGYAPAGAQVVGVELDPTTAAIAQLLHPDATIMSESFAHTRLRPQSYDLVIGNVPFGDFKLHDPKHNPGRRHSIHNHFLLKSLRATKPGGLVALITSRYTMDGQDAAHEQARKDMAALAELVGAIRLPTGAHETAAGTRVVTDLLIWRRRVDGHTGTGPAWQQVRPVELPGARDGVPPAQIAVNEYFLDHPDMVLGQMVAESSRRGPDLAVVHDAAVAPALAGALRRLAGQPAPVLHSEPDLTEGLYQAHPDGTFTQIRDGTPCRYEPPRTQAAELRALIGLRRTVLALLDEEATHPEDTEQMAALRADLNRRYDTYLASFGPINRSTVHTVTRVDKTTGERVEREQRRRPPMGGFRDDPFWPYVMALEDFDDDTQRAAKADVFTKRVVAVATPRQRAETPQDALAICWDAHHEVRLDEIARLLGLAGDQQARAVLGTLVYDEPGTGALVRRTEYLSGNVRRKLAEAEQAAARDSRFKANVEALARVVPRDLTPGEIEARLGSPWISPAYVQQFLREILEDDTVTVTCVTARWSVSGGSRSGVLARTVWGTEKRSALDLASNLLNSQRIEITTTIKRGDREVTVKDEQATAFAQAKALQLDQRFRAWLWEEPERGRVLGRLYNDRFNAIVPQSFDDEQVAAPGLSPAFQLYPHQMAAIARIRDTPGAGLFHPTGAGKTLEMIVGGMELVRLGLVSKPCYVVPKDVLGQFLREFLQAYPRARLLAADSEDLSGDKRRQFVARCSTGAWDAILMTHESFKRIPVSTAVQQEFLNREKQRLEAHLANAEGADRYTVKDIENQIAKLEQKLRDLTDHPGDPDVTFERTGIGYLFVDEGHKYKNRRVLSAIAELAHEGNQITEDLAMKLDHLRATYGPKVVTMATATPIENSPSEILTMTKYIAPHLLAEVGIEADDQFHATFIQPVRRVEMTPDGSRFTSRTRHALYVNLPEAKRLLFSYADIKTKQQLPSIAEPAIVGGKPEILTNQAPTELRQLLSELAARAWAVSHGVPEQRYTKKGELKDDNILWISTDGRLGSLDLRLVGRHTGEPQKIDVLADRVAEIWAAHKDDVYYQADGTPEPLSGSLQLLFCDHGVPKDGWNFYDTLRDQLAARGVPAHMVRYAQEATNRKQKDQLQRDARDGKIAVLVGSRSKLGTGVNIQKRVVAVVQVDPTWKLAPITQSLGRGQRQGNDNDAIHHIFLVTEGSYDPFFWQKVDTKDRFTRMMLDPDDTTRTLELVEDDDSGRVEPAVMFAVGAGRPELLEYARVEQAVAALELEQRIHHSEQFTLKATVEQNQRTITALQRKTDQADQVLARTIDTRGDAFTVQLGGHTHTRRPEAGAALIATLQSASAGLTRGHHQQLTLGSLAGFTLQARIEAHTNTARTAYLSMPEVPESEISFDMADLNTQDPTGLIRQIENRLTAVAGIRERTLQHIEQLRVNITQAQQRIGQPFPKQDDLDQHRDRLAQLRAQLDIDHPSSGPATTGQSPEGAAEAPAPTPAPPAGHTTPPASTQEPDGTSARPPFRIEVDTTIAHAYGVSPDDQAVHNLLSAHGFRATSDPNTWQRRLPNTSDQARHHDLIKVASGMRLAGSPIPVVGPTARPPTPPAMTTEQWLESKRNGPATPTPGETAAMQWIQQQVNDTAADPQVRAAAWTHSRRDFTPVLAAALWTRLSTPLDNPDDVHAEVQRDLLDPDASIHHQLIDFAAGRLYHDIRTTDPPPAAFTPGPDQVSSQPVPVADLRPGDRVLHGQHLDGGPRVATIIRVRPHSGGGVTIDYAGLGNQHHYAGGQAHRVTSTPATQGTPPAQIAATPTPPAPPRHAASMAPTPAAKLTATPKTPTDPPATTTTLAATPGTTTDARNPPPPEPAHSTATSAIGHAVAAWFTDLEAQQPDLHGWDPAGEQERITHYLEHIAQQQQIQSWAKANHLDNFTLVAEEYIQEYFAEAGLGASHIDSFLRAYFDNAELRANLHHHAIPAIYHHARATANHPPTTSTEPPAHASHPGAPEDPSPRPHTSLVETTDPQVTPANGATTTGTAQGGPSSTAAPGPSTNDTPEDGGPGEPSAVSRNALAHARDPNAPPQAKLVAYLQVPVDEIRQLDLVRDDLYHIAETATVAEQSTARYLLDRMDGRADRYTDAQRAAITAASAAYPDPEPAERVGRYRALGPPQFAQLPDIHREAIIADLRQLAESTAPARARTGAYGTTQRGGLAPWVGQAKSLLASLTSTTTGNPDAPGSGPDPGTAPDRQPASPPAPAGLVIDHRPDGTVVRGTSRDDHALQRLLHDHNFKWSQRKQFWYLPRPWKHSTRTYKVRRLTRALDAQGRTYQLHETSTDQPQQPTGQVPRPDAEPYRTRGEIRADYQHMAKAWSTLYTNQTAKTMMLTYSEDSRPDARALADAMRQVWEVWTRGPAEQTVEALTEAAGAARTLLTNLTAQRYRAPKMLPQLEAFTTCLERLAARMAATTAGKQHAPAEDLTPRTAEGDKPRPAETQRQRRGHDFYPTDQQAATIPTLYATERQPLEEKILHLHYFLGGMDWWIAEYDPATRHAFGYTCLGDPTNAEWGTLDLTELEQVTVKGLWVVERDLHWNPVPAAAANLPGPHAPKQPVTPQTGQVGDAAPDAAAQPSAEDQQPVTGHGTSHDRPPPTPRLPRDDGADPDASRPEAGPGSPTRPGPVAAHPTPPGVGPGAPGRTPSGPSGAGGRRAPPGPRR